jgi:hypothetical protein
MFLGSKVRLVRGVDNFIAICEEPRGTLYPQKLALTSSTSGGRSVGIVRSRTQATKFSFFKMCTEMQILHSGDIVEDRRKVCRLNVWELWRQRCRQSLLASLYSRSRQRRPGDLWGCQTLRIPHCLDNRLTDGGRFVSPTRLFVHHTHVIHLRSQTND